MTDFKHLMVDIETLGNKSYSVITSIGAVPFNMVTGETSKEVFYKRINIDNCLDRGLIVNGDTIRWWLKQSEEARMEIYSHSGRTLVDVLLRFTDFVRNNLSDQYQIWGNSNRFDLGILGNAYDKVGIKIPWNFRLERDVRTLVAMNPKIKEEHKWFGVAHNGLDDCFNQIRYCHNTFKSLNLKNHSF